MIHRGCLRLASIIVFGLCLAWVGLVHATFLVTGQGDVSEIWIGPLRGTPAIKPAVYVLFSQYFFVAFGFLLGILVLHGWIRSPGWLGLLAGLLAGLWANTEFFTIPYGGLYTSLPGVLLGSALTGGQNTGPWYYIPVLVTNMIIWSVIGWSLSWIPFVRQWVLRGRT